MNRRAITSTFLVLMCPIGFGPDRVPALGAAAASAAAVECVGDCDSNGSVTIDEIVTGVNLAFGALSLDHCPGFDCDGSGEVSIDCLVAAVIAALNGCGLAPTVTSTPAPTAVVTPMMTPPPTVRSTSAATASATPTMTSPSPVSSTPAATTNATPTPSSLSHFVDNGDGTISDTETGLMWEKKDLSGGAHDVDSLFPWTGVCTDQNKIPCSGVIGCTFCQPDAAAESTCNAATGGAVGCARCPGTALCQPINGLTTVWQWLNELNDTNFAGHNDWRIPTIARDGGAVQLETTIDTTVAGCGSGVPCTAAAFNTGCTNGCSASTCSCTNIGQYWSATTIAEALPLPSVWSVLFFRGTVGGADKTSGFFARAVRSVPCGAFLAKFGSQGGGDGQFFDPEAIAVDRAGDFFVADSGNHRIEKFTDSGRFLRQWGGMGEGPGQFHTPAGLAVDADGNVYVADLNNNRIEKFDNDGNFLTAWGEAGSAERQFSGPVGVAIDAQGNVLVADRFNDRVQTFTSSGDFVRKWGSTGLGDGQFSNPVGVAVDRDMNVYVADFFNNRIQKFTSTGMFVGKWGSNGSGEGQFIGARAVAVTSGGAILAIDDGNDRVEAFTDTGVFLTTWGTPGNHDGQFDSATALAVAPNGSVWVTDQAPRVQRFACSAPPAP
jgi:sugar lactone lactonase YvrE